MKICRICGIEKPLTDFYYRKDSKKYRSECKDCTIELHRFKETGWSPSDYEKAYHRQNGKCAICGCTLNSSRFTRFSADHDHKSGKLRGLLCNNCNTAIGLMKDSIIRLQNAIEYLKKWNPLPNEDIVCSHG